MDPLVILDGIGVSLGGRPVLRDVTLTIDPGRILGITGPNGSGKTTLLRLIATLVPPDLGRGRVLGVSLATPEMRTVRSQIGMIGHTPALVPELTLRENLTHVCRIAGIDPSRIDRVLEVVGLEEVEDRRVEVSSHGMQRRVEIAHLLLRRPRLILLDEATTGLDVDAQDLIGALMDRTLEDEGGVVMVSHDAAQLGGSHQIVALHAGRVTA